MKIKMSDFCMPVGDGELYWRKKPKDEIITELNKKLKENNYFKATERGISTTFVYDWDQWITLLADLNKIGEFIQKNRCSLKGGLYFVKGKEFDGDIVPTKDYAEKWSCRGGEAKKCMKGKVFACRTINRRK